MTVDYNRLRISLRIRQMLLLISLAVLITSTGVQIQAETLTLDQALEIAFANSPTVRDAALNLDASEHSLNAQLAALKSRFSLTVTPHRFSKERTFYDLYSKYYISEQTSSEARLTVLQPIKWTDATLSIIESISRREAANEFNEFIKQETYSNDLFLQFHQPLFTYNRTKLTLKEHELALENARLNFAIQKLYIENSVTQSFLNLYHMQRSLEISREELANATESYEIIASKVDAGISALEELYQAELTQANSRASLEHDQMQYENALDNFKITLGISLDRPLDVVADIRKQLVEVRLDHAVGHGLENRIELRQQDIAIENALNDLIIAGAQNEFKASFDLSYGITGIDSVFSDIFSSTNRTQTVALSVNIPLFDWGEKKHRMAASRARLESNRLSASETRKQVEYEIRQSFRNLQNQKTQIEIAEKNVKNARLTYEINLERYRNGDLSSKDISFYQNQLSSEQLNEVRALINYRLVLLELKIKTLWDFENNKAVID